MSDFHVEVVRVGPLTKNMNSDSLWMTKVRDYVVQIKEGEFKENDLAVYVPEDSVVPADDSRWEFLKGRYRIKAMRLRGVFSMGLLTKAEPTWKLGQDVAEELRIKKYVPPEDLKEGWDNEQCPFTFPEYTDLESLRRWPDMMKVGEEVVITEKLDGASGRYVWKDGRLWVGSHHQILKESAGNQFWKAARKINLAEKLEKKPNLVFFGEVFGCVQKLKYGHMNGDASLLFFDILDMDTMKFMDFEDFMKTCEALTIPTVPILCKGAWNSELRNYGEGKSHISKDQIKEGFVMKPVKEGFEPRLPGQRLILKYHGEQYLLSK